MGGRGLCAFAGIVALHMEYILLDQKPRKNGHETIKFGFNSMD